MRQYFSGLFMASLTLGLLLAFSARAGELPPVHLVETTDLSADAQLARYRQVPIVLMFAMEDCGYCHVIEEEFLKPMLRNDAYDDKVLIRRLMVDEGGTITHFDGSETTPDALALQYGAQMTPTLVFLGPDGRELAPRIVGVRTVDFYGWDLDKGIDTSLSKIRDVAYQPGN